MFQDDTLINPKESEHFGELDKNGNLLEMENTALYKEDWIGLKGLNEQKKIWVSASEGDHIKFNQFVPGQYFVPFLFDKEFMDPANLKLNSLSFVWNHVFDGVPGEIWREELLQKSQILWVNYNKFLSASI